MADEAPRPPENTAGERLQGQDLGGPDAGPWAPPGERGPVSGPPENVVSGSGYEQQTVAPGPNDAVPQAWASPFAPPTPGPSAGGPANPFAPPGPGAFSGQPVNPFAPPAAQPQDAVPPPPISPDGPGQVPYGYPGAPAGYGYPAPHGGYYGWPGMQPMPSNGMGTAGLVLGILAAIGFCMWPIAIVLGVLAVIFGALGRGKARRGEATNPGQALAGIICGAVGIVLALVVIAFVIATNAGGA
ncbi:DUF4190 domain-containing protein [Streptomyces sp. NPDC005209]|uniref:DUF4190 domain-containing protein n=1 Tax=Streptomyces sp. NPDC005209 TaxID=3156715 RepID=UPI0033B2DBA9